MSIHFVMKSLIILLICLSIHVCIQAQIGKVGINTATPAALLHVRDSSVVFTGPASIPAPGDPPITGAGTRMMWYANKAAFRVGRLIGSPGSTFWNKDSVGLYSVAMGYNTKASGQASIAMGELTTASYYYATAMGTRTTASGYASIAMGDGTTASAASSTAIGKETTANGFASTAMGSDTKASGQYSTAMGQNTSAAGSVSTAIGKETKAKSYASVVLGQYNETTSTNSNQWALSDPVFSIGNENDNAARSNAMTDEQNENTGINTFLPLAMLHENDSIVLFTRPTSIPAPGNPPVTRAGTRMMWYANKAAFRAGYVSGTYWDKDSIGNYSVAFGWNTQATGSSSFAQGIGPRAYGQSSCALGRFNEAIGDNSFTTGELNDAIATRSICLGYLNKTGGSNSRSHGYRNIANGYASLVTGMLNDTIVAAESSSTQMTPLFIVGNGNIGSPPLQLINRSNAFIVLKNGNVGVGNIIPQYRLHVKNNLPSVGWEEGVVIENDTTGEAALSFISGSMPENRRWHIGLNSSPRLAFCYGSAFTSTETKVTID